MSKQSSEPISDFASSAFTRARRSRRRRSKSMRCSQSTAIDPIVLMAIIASFVRLGLASLPLGAVAEDASGFENCFFAGDGCVFERWRKRNGHMHGAHALYGTVEIMERLFSDQRRDFGG